MALQIRRGAEAQRAGIVPLEGELLYVTDTHLLYVGDGTQSGGHPVGISGGDVTGPFSSIDTAVPTFHGTTGKEIQNSLVTIGANGRITAPTVSNIIPFNYLSSVNFPAAANVSGAVAFSSSEEKFFYAGTSSWKELLSSISHDLSPKLGGNLDVHGRSITTTLTNGDINLEATGTGSVNIVNSDLTIDGNINKTGTLLINSNAVAIGSVGKDGVLNIIRYSYPDTDAGVRTSFSFNQTHSSASSVPLTFLRGKGNPLFPSSVANADELGGFRFDGQYSGLYVTGGKITAVIEGSPGASSMPTKFQFSTHNGSAVAVRAELSSGGILKVDQINSLTTSQLTLNTALKLAVISITGLSSGDVTLGAADITGNILICAPSADRNLTLPDATITSLRGAFAIIRNTSGSFAVTVKNSNGSTLTTLNASSVRGIYNDGSSWFAY
jgi:hypothetical protein